jgi:TolB-like protein/DNA-binding winged helix-turn-helix (wHTH) protein/tetratricopeptide (TPR) repeat protein
MDRTAPKPRAARFGLFEVDFEQRILTKGGLRIKLQDQPFQVLAMLLARPGELVAREEIRQRLWRADTFVEFDDGLNTAIKKLRAALNDSADNPRFIETVPRRGYRFLAPVTTQVSVHQTEAAEIKKALASKFGTAVSTREIAPAAASSEMLLRSAPAARHWVRSWPMLAVVTLPLCTAALFSFLFKLQGFSRRPLASERATLIVIPLDNLSGDPQQEYFSDGFTEEISTQLARLAPDRLGVIGRLTAMKYKHSGKDIAQIAREIPVQYVLEGSVRRDQTRLRVTVQLIEASHQTHVWADEYDRDLGDTLGLQREIAMAVARQIKVKLTPESEHNLELGSPATAAAHDAYLKGLYQWNKRTEEGFRSAIRYFEAALRNQKDYAPADAGLADSYNLLGEYGFARPEEAYPKAKDYAQKALQLDGSLAEAYTALADVEIKYDRDWAKGASDFERALKLDPNYATAHLWYAEDFLTPSGKPEQAITEVKKAQEIEPLSPITGAIVAETLYFAHDYNRAIQEAKSVLEMEPTFLPALERLGWAYEQKGMFPEAISEFQRALALSQGSSEIEMKAQLAHAYALSGKTSEARQILSDLLVESRTQYISPYFLAVIYTALGEKDSAVEWLERTYQAHDVPPIQVEPRFDSLRADGRFQELLRKSGPN